MLKITLKFVNKYYIWTLEEGTTVALSNDFIFSFVSISDITFVFFCDVWKHWFFLGHVPLTSIVNVPFLMDPTYLSTQKFL